VLELARAQAQSASEVRLFATDPAHGYRRAEGALVVDVFKRGAPSAICPSRDLKAVLAQTHAEAVHCHGLWLRTVAYAMASANRSGAPFVLAPRGMMGPWAWSHHRIRKWLASTLVHPGAFRAVSGWHATSDEEAADIRRLGFTGEICTAPNGVQIPSEEEINASRDSWGKLVPEYRSRPIALFYSRFHSKKRVEELIRLWAGRNDDGWLLLVAGIPEQFSCASLRELAASLGCTSRVRVADGEALPPPYAIASLFVLPSHNENFGLVIAEAMAFRLPIVVTDTTPWKRVNQLGAGWCVPWQEFGSALTEATRTSPEALAFKGRAARDWVASDFSWAKPSRQLLEFYETLRK
jgi:glycosyltransferase involved in cell wall biosynthesis